MTRTELETIVAERESTVLEFKATTGRRSAACKTLTGTLNGSGGRALFGVDQEGIIKGQDVSDRTVEQLAGELSHIEPTVLANVERVELPTGRSVISVSVGTGQLRPYEYKGAARSGRLVDPGTANPREILRRLGLLSRGGHVLRAAVVLFSKREGL